MGGIHPVSQSKNIDASWSGWPEPRRPNGQEYPVKSPPSPFPRGRANKSIRLISLSLVLAPRYRYAYIRIYRYKNCALPMETTSALAFALHTRYIKCNESFGFPFFFLILISAGFVLNVNDREVAREKESRGFLVIEIISP